VIVQVLLDHAAPSLEGQLSQGTATFNVAAGYTIEREGDTVRISRKENRAEWIDVPWSRVRHALHRHPLALPEAASEAYVAVAPPPAVSSGVASVAAKPSVKRK
jgi:hypothetical protein